MSPRTRRRTICFHALAGSNGTRAMVQPRARVSFSSRARKLLAVAGIDNPPENGVPLPFDPKISQNNDLDPDLVHIRCISDSQPAESRIADGPRCGCLCFKSGLPSGAKAPSIHGTYRRG